MNAIKKYLCACASQIAFKLQYVAASACHGHNLPISIQCRQLYFCIASIPIVEESLLKHEKKYPDFD